MIDAQTNGASTARVSTLARRCLVAFCLVAVVALSLVFAGSALAANDICGYAYLEPHGSTYGENGEIAEYNLVIQESEPQGSGFIYLGPVRTSGYTEDNVPPWKSYRDWDKIVEVSINGTINPASMSSWFRDCPGIRNVNLKGVSGAALTDMSDCFRNCDHLTSVSFSGVDTSHVTKMDGMFTWCDSLESLDLSPLSTSHVTNMNNMFSYCSSLRDVDLSSLNTSQVSDMSWMFAECSSLSELDLARFNTSNATNMGSMFFRCRSLKSLDLSSFDTRKVEKMPSMFEGCLALTSVNVSSFDVSRVGDTSNMFESCSSLRGIDLSSFSFDMSIVGEDGESPIRGAFGDCNLLSTLTIGPRLGDWSFLGGLFDAGVTWRCVSDGEGATFEYGQDMLSYVESKGTPQTFVSTRSSDDIVAIALSDGETLAIRTGQRDLAQGERLLGIATLNTLPWRGSRFSKVVFENRVQPLSVRDWFSEIESLREIDGLENFVMPEDGDLSGMFSGCESLSSLDLSSFDTSSVTDMLGLFDSCSSLESVDISSFRTARATTLYAMFRWCESLRAVDLSRFDTSHVTDIGDMFNGCTSLRELDLSPFDTSNVTNMGGLFRDCTSLERLDVSHFDFGKVVSIDFAFSGCTKLGKLSLGSIDFTSISSTENVFDACVNLNTVEVASGAKFKAETFPEGMWRSSADGKTYRSDEVPSGVAATYTRVSSNVVLYALLDTKGVLTITATRPAPGPGDEVFSFTNEAYSSSDETPWSSRRNDILAVRVLDAPNVSTVAHWFDGCARLASADFTGLSSEVVNDTMFLFAGCTSLRDAILPTGLHLDYSVAGMFSGCSSLTSVSMPDIDVGFVHDFDEMFRGCSSLVELDLSGFDTRQAESMKRMFHGCRSLQRVKLGPNFTFRGKTYSRLPGSELPDGAWQPEGEEARAYASDSLPSFTEATYVKVDASTPGLTVESLRGDTADGKAKYSVSTTLVEGTDGLEAVSDYELDPAFASDTFMVGETASASSTATLTSRTVTRTAVGKVSAPARVTHVIVGSQVRSIKERAFADASHVTQLTVKSTHLTKKARVYRCLTGSKVTKVHVKMSSKYAQKVATALRKWACK